MRPYKFDNLDDWYLSLNNDVLVMICDNYAIQLKLSYSIFTGGGKARKTNI